LGDIIINYYGKQQKITYLEKRSMERSIILKKKQ